MLLRAILFLRVGTNGIKASCLLVFCGEGRSALCAEDRVLCWLCAKTLKDSTKPNDELPTKVFLAETGRLSSSLDWAPRASTEHRSQSKGQARLSCGSGWGTIAVLTKGIWSKPFKEFGEDQSKLWLNPLRMAKDKWCCITWPFACLRGRWHRECSKGFPASNESKQCMQGAYKIIAKRALSFCSGRFFLFFYLPITKLHDFFASLIKQLIDAGAL